MSFAFVFAGQGSQSVGMLAALAAAEPAVRATFDEASGVLGYDLWQLVSAGPEEALNVTERTQPAMLAAGVAVWRVWRARGGALPTVVSGHSLGEFTALVCAGSLEYPAAKAHQLDRGRVIEGVRAHERGELPQAVPGHHRGQGSATPAPHPPYGNAGSEHRRLGALGGVQCLLGPSAHELPQVVAKYPGGLVEGGTHGRRSERERPEHADRLRALPREYERERHDTSATRAANYTDTRCGVRNAATAAPPATP